MRLAGGGQYTVREANEDRPHTGAINVNQAWNDFTPPCPAQPFLSMPDSASAYRSSRALGRGGADRHGPSGEPDARAGRTRAPGPVWLCGLRRATGAHVRTYMRMLTMIDQITNPSRAGKLAGGMIAAIPSTIATQPSYFGSAAPRRIATPAQSANTNAPPTIGMKSSLVRTLSVCTTCARGGGAGARGRIRPQCR